MSRLSLLAAALLSFTAAASTQAVITYYPAPVPAPSCTSAYETLNPYYQHQLYVLNHPYGGYGSIDLTANPCARPTVDLLQNRCEQPAPAGYYRKSDLLPHPAAAADDPHAHLTPTAKGTVIIIPKALLNRPLKSFQPRPTTPLASRD